MGNTKRSHLHIFSHNFCTNHPNIGADWIYRRVPAGAEEWRQVDELCLHYLRADWIRAPQISQVLDRPKLNWLQFVDMYAIWDIYFQLRRPACSARIITFVRWPQPLCRTISAQTILIYLFFSPPPPSFAITLYLSLLFSSSLSLSLKYLSISFFLFFLCCDQSVTTTFVRNSTKPSLRISCTKKSRRKTITWTWSSSISNRFSTITTRAASTFPSARISCQRMTS